MKEDKDKKIQEMLEKSISPEEAPIVDDDFLAYQLVFKELQKEPDLQLSTDFSFRVVAGIQAMKDRKNDMLFYCIIGLMSIICISAAFFLVGKESWLHIGSVIVDYKWIFLVGLIFFLIVQYLDQKIIIPKQYKFT